MLVLRSYNSVLKKGLFISMFLCFIVLMNVDIAAQDTIFLKNPSFEGVPEKGRLLSKVGQSEIFSEKNKLYTTFNMEGWKDCGCEYCTPPDIHPDSIWGNQLEPANGKTYLGMVAGIVKLSNL